MKKVFTIPLGFALSFLMIVFLCGISFAQHQPFFVNINEADGLSDNHVKCFFKDRTGYVWIGTENGLNRYDGNGFKIYKPAAYKRQRLSNAYITAVSQDYKGDIWVATQYGLNRIDAITDTTEILNIQDKEHLINLSAESFWDVLPDEENIWIAIDTKPLLCHNRRTKQNRYFDFKNFLKINHIEKTPLYHSIFRIIPQGNTGLWLATTEGIVHLNKQTGAFTMLAAIALDEITFFKYNEANGKIYCADERNILYSYDVNSKKLNTILPDAIKHSGKYLQPYYNGRDQFFLPAQQALVLVDNRDRMISYITGNNNQANSVFAGKVNTVYTDRDGITWIGGDKGISKFIPRLNSSLHVSFPKNLLFDEEFSLKNILYQPAGNNWLIASYADNKIWSVDNVTAAITEFTRPAAYKNDTCYAFYSRHADTIFLLCDGALLSYFAKEKKWTKIILPAPWNTGTLTCMAIDAGGNYWLGTRRKGLVVYNSITKKVWTPYSKIEEANIIHALQFDVRNNCMWIGTYSTGLHRYNFADKKIQYIKRDDADSAAMHASLINDLVIHAENIWVATVEGGLTKINGSTLNIKNYNYENGLPDNNVYSVTNDEKGNIFFGTAKGIGKIGINGVKTIFNEQNILPFNSCRQAIVCLANGRVATCFENRFFCFDSEALQQQSRAAVVVTQVVLNDSVLCNLSESKYRYNQNSFQISYAALDFATPAAIEYYCMLEGFDNGWINNLKQQTIRYANLPPGKYVFKVKAIGANGIMLPQIAAYNFSIIPPFWKSWWFILLMLLAIIAGILFLVTRRIKTIRSQEKIKRQYEKKIAETEMQALRAQMNPHFMFNSLNSINNFILKNDAENASGYLTKFSRLMRLILDNSRSEWVLLESELKALELYIALEAVRFDNAFEYSIEVTKDVNVQAAMVPPLIIQPYVENAIWHGLMHRKQAGGELDIRLWRNGDKLYIEIEDNGVGRQEAGKLNSKTATQKKSHGMKITAERMDIVNKVYNVDVAVNVTDLKDDNGNANGTSVLITLKYRTHDSHNS